MAKAQVPGSGPGPDERWLTGMDGRHRQVFDVSSLKGGAVLNPVRNFLNAYNEAYGVPDAELSAAVVVHGSALPIVFGDEAWERWGFGERHAITDPSTGRPARRNIFRPARPEMLGPLDASVEALQRRGVVFLLCNNSLKRAAGEAARASGGDPEEVRKAMIAGLLSGVVVVPAAVVAINRAQEHGLSYVFLG